jgi:hypothetical protein
MRSLSALFIEEPLEHLPRLGVCSLSNMRETRQSGTGKTAFRTGLVRDPLSEALYLVVQGRRELIEKSIQLNGFGSDHRFGAQLAYAIFQSSRSEMPGDETAQQGSGGCFCIVHHTRH